MIDGEKVRALRAKQNWSQVELAEAADVPQSRISEIERNKIDRPSATILYQLAKALGVPADELLRKGQPDEPPKQPARSVQERLDQMERLLANARLDTTVRVPILRSYAIAGSGSIPHDQILGYLEMEASYAGRELYAIRVRGECLVPDVMPDDLAVFEHRAPLKDGKYVVVLHDGEMLVKRLTNDHHGGWRLESNHQPAIPVSEETEQVCGVVLEFRRKV